MIESNIIYNFEDFKTLVSSKAKEGSYYLLYDDLYFEKIDKNTMITREAYTVAGRYTKSFNIIKYINFKVKDDYTTKEISEFIEILRKHTTILLTIFNPKKKDCFFMFISNRNDEQIEKQIENLLGMEE